MTGWYEGGGYQWAADDVPMCSMCFEEIATLATTHLGILLCDDPSCHTAYVMQECDLIEFFEEEDEDG